MLDLNSLYPALANLVILVSIFQQKEERRNIVIAITIVLEWNDPVDMKSSRVWSSISLVDQMVWEWIANHLYIYPLPLYLFEVF